MKIEATLRFLPRPKLAVQNWFGSQLLSSHCLPTEYSATQHLSSAFPGV